MTIYFSEKITLVPHALSIFVYEPIELKDKVEFLILKLIRIARVATYRDKFDMIPMYHDYFSFGLIVDFESLKE